MLARDTDTRSNDIQIVAVNKDQKMIVAGTNSGAIDSFKVLRTPKMHLRRQAKTGIL
jgi:hypothetical protein